MGSLVEMRKLAGITSRWVGRPVRDEGHSTQDMVARSNALMARAKPAPKKKPSFLKQVFGAKRTESEEADEPSFPTSGADAMLRKPAAAALGGAKKKKLPTFAQKQAELFDHLKKEGWTVVTHLKVPYATSKDGQTRLWFKTQSVQMSKGSKHTLGDARSMWSDIREMDADTFMKAVHRWAAR